MRRPESGARAEAADRHGVHRQPRHARRRAGSDASPGRDPGSGATVGDERPPGLHLRGRGPDGPRRPSRGDAGSPIDCGRLSDRRSPGMDPGPQGAFEVSMINVSCNSHYFSQLAAFFIDA